jgi:nitroimidazol reductase NimA-like FMN-containing flavoprotein (pyridoxamine 5'-phosphate oxidase superfamily)
MELVDEGLELLSEEECRVLLADGQVGRVAVTLGALPTVLPVNYGLLDGDIVFLTGDGTKLDAALRNAVVAFEVDEIDPLQEGGWSVLAIGAVREITDGSTLSAAQALGIRPWAHGVRTHFVRLHPEVLTGRRIAEPVFPYP